MLEDVFKNIDDICMFNSKKVLEAFWKCHVSEAHFTEILEEVQLKRFIKQYLKLKTL